MFVDLQDVEEWVLQVSCLEVPADIRRKKALDLFSGQDLDIRGQNMVFDAPKKTLHEVRSARDADRWALLLPFSCVCFPATVMLLSPSNGGN